MRAYITTEGHKVLRRAPKPLHGVIPDALDRMPTAALLRLDRDLEKLLQLAGRRDRRSAMEPFIEP